VKEAAIHLVSGVVFGLGLVVSGMFRQETVLAFLQLTDLGLLLTMGMALAVALPAYKLAARRQRAGKGTPRYETLPGSVRWNHVLGGVIFGLGWGLSGICPGAAFASLEDAFDPATNVIYATRFLIRLYAETGSWGAAVALYHSRTRKLYLPYRARVFRAWSARSGQRLATLAARHLDGAERATVRARRRSRRRPGAVSGATPAGARLVRMAGRNALFAPPPRVIRGASKSMQVHTILQQADARSSARNFLINRYLRPQRTDARTRKTYGFAPALLRKLKRRPAAGADAKPQRRLYYQRGTTARTYRITPFRKR